MNSIFALTITVCTAWTDDVASCHDYSTQASLSRTDCEWLAEGGSIGDLPLIMLHVQAISFVTVKDPEYVTWECNQGYLIYR